MEVRHSVCALDCPDACSLLVDIDGERATRLRGNPDHRSLADSCAASGAVSGSPILARTRCSIHKKRIGAKGEGRFERISWDEALDTSRETWRAARSTVPSPSCL
jgi:anaerobic selenocysteine-containing dehydrogenase